MNHLVYIDITQFLFTAGELGLNDLRKLNVMTTSRALYSIHTHNIIHIYIVPWYFLLLSLLLTLCINSSVDHKRDIKRKNIIIKRPILKFVYLYDYVPVL